MRSFRFSNNCWLQNMPPGEPPAPPPVTMGIPWIAFISRDWGQDSCTKQLSLQLPSPESAHPSSSWTQQTGKSSPMPAITSSLHAPASQGRDQAHRGQGWYESLSLLTLVAQERTLISKGDCGLPPVPELPTWIRSQTKLCFQIRWQ